MYAPGNVVTPCLPGEHQSSDIPTPNGRERVSRFAPGDFEKFQRSFLVDSFNVKKWGMWHMSTHGSFIICIIKFAVNLGLLVFKKIPALGLKTSFPHGNHCFPLMRMSWCGWTSPMYEV